MPRNFNKILRSCIQLQIKDGGPLLVICRKCQILPTCRQHPLQPKCRLRPPLYTYIRIYPLLPIHADQSVTLIISKDRVQVSTAAYMQTESITAYMNAESTYLDHQTRYTSLHTSQHSMELAGISARKGGLRRGEMTWTK
jgi:hypothetical protein